MDRKLIASFTSALARTGPAPEGDTRWSVRSQSAKRGSFWNLWRQRIDKYRWPQAEPKFIDGKANGSRCRCKAVDLEISRHENGRRPVPVLG